MEITPSCVFVNTNRDSEERAATLIRKFCWAPKIQCVFVVGE